MIRVVHRVNSTELLQDIPKDFGVEIDIRSKGSELILRHDVGDQGCKLDEYLNFFNHRLIIFNVKEDGLEEAILTTASGLPNLDYFFLDQPFPSLVRTSALGYSTAIRVSEFEALPAMPLQCKWIWLDSFTGSWSHINLAIKYAKENNLRTCMVAPELQGRQDKAENIFLAKNYSNQVDAICTKVPSSW